MNTISILNWLHKKQFHALLAGLCQLGYRLKGFKKVEIEFHSSFRAYEYRVDGISYMSMGPGWAYNYNFLEESLLYTYNYFYKPKAGDCIVDLGAGLGEESVIYSQLVGDSGKVYSIEANKTTFQGLAYLQSKNKFKQMFPLNIAIYFEETMLSIEDDADNYLTNTVKVASESGTNQVAAMSFDMFAKRNEVTHIDFLKSNIEGAEQFLIQGMEDSISMVKNVCISCHDFRHVYHNHGEFYVTKDKIREYLIDKGFEILERERANRVIDDFIYARNLKWK